MNINGYPEDAQDASLKEVMGQPPMTLEHYQLVQERRVAVRRQMEDIRLRRSMDDYE